MWLCRRCVEKLSSHLCDLSTLYALQMKDICPGCRVAGDLFYNVMCKDIVFDSLVLDYLKGGRTIQDD